MDRFITYEGLPLKSGGAHHLGRTPPAIVYTSVCSFLSQYTDTTQPKYVKIELTDFKFTKLLKHSLKFGIPSFNLDHLLANGQARFHWKSAAKNIEAAIAYCTDKHELSIAVLWKFLFIDEIERSVLPGQSELPILDERMHNSQLYLRLSAKRSTISVWFALPFDTLSARNIKYITGIQSVLPFKFSEHCWRQWTLSKNGNWIPKKIKIP